MRRSILIRGAGAATLLALALACGGAGSPSTPTTAQTTPATPAPEPDPAPAATVKWAASEGSLCTDGENEILSCAMEKGGKQLSICASPDLSETGGMLQYRFGKPGAVELTLPADGIAPQGVISVTHAPTDATVDAWYLEFDNAGTYYQVMNKSHRSEGDSVAIVVGPGTSAEVKLWCKDPIHGSLSRLDDRYPVDFED